MKFKILVLSLPFFILSCKTDKKSVPLEKETTSAETKTKTSATTENTGDFNSISLTKLWESDSTLMTPESVLFDETKGVYYVSCIGNVPPTKEDGDGYIAMLNQKGEILNGKWVEGLDAPKGMGLLDGKLYVTDINELVVIDIETAKIDIKYRVPGSTFLNDVSIAPNGVVYFTDSNENTIYSYEKNIVTIFKKENGLGGSNGIHAVENKMFVAGFGNGDLNSINIKSKKVTKVGDGIVPNGDGIAPWGEGFLISNWAGEVYYTNQEFWPVLKVLDTKEEGQNAADIAVNNKSNELLIPTFFGNKVVAYKIENQTD